MRVVSIDECTLECDGKCMSLDIPMIGLIPLSRKTAESITEVLTKQQKREIENDIKRTDTRSD